MTSLLGLTAGLGLPGMFAAAFLAATPVPFQSEIVFLGLFATGSVGVWPLICAASAGNTLGSCVTYAAGRGLGAVSRNGRFSIPADRLARAEAWFDRWGMWLLLLSWAPGGDLIVATAGALRVPFWRFVLLVAVAKTGRYLVLGAVASGLFSVWGAR